MLPALIAAGTTILGGVLQSNAANKAADRQAEAQAQALEAQKRAAEQARGVYSPTVTAYGGALNALTGRLGLPQNSNGSPAGAAGSTDWVAYLAANPDAQAWVNSVKGTVDDHFGGDEMALAQSHWQQDGQRRPLTTVAAPPTQPTPTGNALTGSAQTGTGTFGNTADPTWEAPSYQAPPEFSFSVDSFKDNPAYKFALEQGSGQVMANSAATGALNSGAALKALQDRGQKTAYGFYADERDSAYDRYNTDRNFSRNAYENDRNFDRSTYESDRSYLTGRYDRATDDLARYTGLTQNALTGTANAYLGEGNSTADGLLGIGSASAGNALAQGNIWSQMVGSLGGQAAGIVNSSSRAKTLEDMIAAAGARGVI